MLQIIRFVILFLLAIAVDVASQEDGDNYQLAESLQNNGELKEAFQRYREIAHLNNHPKRADAAFRAGMIIVRIATDQTGREAAIPYFNLAQTLNHPHAKLMVEQIKGYEVAVRAPNSFQSSQQSAAEKSLPGYQAALIKAHGTVKLPSRVRVMYFTTIPNKIGNSIIGLEREHPDIDFSYWLVIPDINSRPFTQKIEGVLVPVQGYTPDIGGDEAARLSIRTFPAFVIQIDDRTQIHYSFSNFITAIEQLVY